MELALTEFAKLTPTDTPKYLSTDIDDKINLLKRETNYLLTKAQRFVPKTKTTTAKPTAKTNDNNKAEDDKSSTTENPESEETSTTTPSTEGKIDYDSSFFKANDWFLFF